MKEMTDSITGCRENKRKKLRYLQPNSGRKVKCSLKTRLDARIPGPNSRTG